VRRSRRFFFVTGVFVVAISDGGMRNCSGKDSRRRFSGALKKPERPSQARKRRHGFRHKELPYPVELWKEV
jgi:hypothetical protein